VWRAWLTVGRDVICLVLGIWGVIREELQPHPDLTRMAFFGILMICPGVLAAWWLGRTGSPSVVPPPEPSPASSSSPPSLP
jgi:hypothetical protein